MTKREKILFYKKLKEVISNSEVKKMQNFNQHGSTTTFDHCLSVAYYSYVLSKKMRLNINEKELLRGAMLHDFYLYDWHDSTFERQKLHGYNHPKSALNNAKKHFDLTKKEENIISSHMWPLTLRKLPKSKEAALICLMDKCCAIWEMKTHYFTFLKKIYYI